MYHKRLTEKGYDLERGIKGSDNKNIKIKEYKRLTKKLNHELSVKNERFVESLNDFEEKMKTTKQTFIVDKDYVKVKKDTFDSMNNVIKESKKVMELQPKLQAIFNEVDSYANSYKSLEKENQKYKKEVNKLEYENKTLEQENRSLIYRLNELFQLLKKFLRKLLQRGDDYTKDETLKLLKIIIMKMILIWKMQLKYLKEQLNKMNYLIMVNRLIIYKKELEIMMNMITIKMILIQGDKNQTK